MRIRQLNPKPIFQEEDLADFLERHGAKPLHMPVIWRTLLQSGGDFDELEKIGTFPKRLIPKLKKEFTYCTSRLACYEQSALDGTIKLLIKLQDGKEIESVIINHTGEDMSDLSNFETKEDYPHLKFINIIDNKDTILKEDTRIELRKTLCVSSQVGCKLGCTFCATGTMKLEASLTSGEIMEQLLLADHVLTVLGEYGQLNGAKNTEKSTDNDNNNVDNNQLTKLEVIDLVNKGRGVCKKILLKSERSTSTNTNTNSMTTEIQNFRITDSDSFIIWSPYKQKYISNIVFMGMGEPLEAYDSVTKALKGLIHNQRFSLAQRNITISTVGIVDKMREIFLNFPSIKLALSLHAPNQNLREIIVPISRKKEYHIKNLMEVIMEYSERHETDGKRKGLVMISYIMIDGINDSIENCNELCELLKNQQVMVNLIPFNKFDPYSNMSIEQKINLKDKIKQNPSLAHPAEKYKPSKPERITYFMEKLIQNGIKAFERRPHGRDISAACGQLAKLKKVDEKVFEEVEDVIGVQRSHINKVVPLSRELVRKKFIEKLNACETAEERKALLKEEEERRQKSAENVKLREKRFKGNRRKIYNENGSVIGSCATSTLSSNWDLGSIGDLDEYLKELEEEEAAGFSAVVNAVKKGFAKVCRTFVKGFTDENLDNNSTNESSETEIETNSIRRIGRPVHTDPVRRGIDWERDHGMKDSKRGGITSIREEDEESGDSPQDECEPDGELSPSKSTNWSNTVEKSAAIGLTTLGIIGLATVVYLGLKTKKD